MRNLTNREQRKRRDDRTDPEVPSYQPPRIVTHSSESLDRITLSVNACASFTTRRDEAEEDEGEAVSY